MKDYGEGDGDEGDGHAKPAALPSAFDAFDEAGRNITCPSPLSDH